MKRRSLILGGLAVGALLFGAGAFGVARSAQHVTATSVSPAGPAAAAGLAHISGASLDQAISELQRHLTAVPGDYVAWSTLGLAYVQQAKVTANPEYYTKAEGVLQTSLQIDDSDNFLVHAGLAALANARHEFAEAKEHARRGLAINGYSSILYGALSDAETQLGEYSSAFASVQRMVDLSPDTASLSRASYTWELRGDNEQATSLMQQALETAPNASTRAFALVHLGGLAFDRGDVNEALRYFRDAIDASPTDPGALAGKARAEAALGQHLTALDDYAAVVARAPEPSHVLEYGELLQSLGRTQGAEQQYAVFAATQRLFGANGVAPDADQVLFEADHGDPVRALQSAEQGIATRPFLSMHDAHAWALHVNGRDVEALAAVDRALSTGVENALFRYHRGMIQLALGNEAAARTDLAGAMAINPHFNPLAVPVAVATLDDLGPGRAERASP